MISSGCLIGGGDLVSQKMLEDGRIDYYRVFCRGSCAMVLYSVFFVRFYNWLFTIEKYLPLKYVKFHMPLKVCADVFFATPFIFLPWFGECVGYIIVNNYFKI